MRRSGMAWTLAALLAAGVWLSAGSSHAADEAKVSVQAVKATEPGKKNEDLPASLKPYASILNKLGFGKYADGGSDSGSAAAGAKATLKAGGYTLEVTVGKIENGETTIKYVIKNAAGKEVGSNTVSLKSGSSTVTQVEEPAQVMVFIIKVD